MKLSEVKKLKVVQLRVILKERGLDIKGLKAELVARLWSALENQSEQLPSGRDGSPVTEGIPLDVEEKQEHPSEIQPDQQPQVNVLIETNVLPQEAATDISPGKGKDSTNQEIRTNLEDLSSVSDDSGAFKSNIVNIDHQAVSTGYTVKSVTQQYENEKGHRSMSPDVVNEGSLACDLTTPKDVFHTTEILSDTATATKTGNLSKCHVASEEDKPKMSRPSPKRNEGIHPGQENNDNFKSMETVTTSVGPTAPLQSQEEDQSNKRSWEGRDRSYYEFKEEVRYNRAKTPDSHTVNEEKVDEQRVVLDSYNSDLHFKVGDDGISGHPLFWDKFPLLWSGCRLSHGVHYGKVSFEVKYVQRLASGALDTETDPEPSALRVGWSIDGSGLQLGETELSYGYDSRGWKVTQGRKEDFGEPFSEGDVISCYAWISDSQESELSFFKNGRSLGEAFRLAPSHLKGRTLYPHVLCKNCSVSLNLDPLGGPWYQGLAGFTPLPALQPHQRTLAPRPPASREECEVVMMVGMPGSGKTRWAQAHMTQHPEKRYTLLSTDTVLACMRVGGTEGCAQREVVLQQATRSLTELIRVAAGKRRNYILDQANVYPSSRRHKMLLFRGFHRRAVVVFPSDKEWQRRLAQQHKEHGKAMPEEPLLKVKVSFTLPEAGDLLEEVAFVELPREEVQRLLTAYKEEARQLLPSPPKRKKYRHKHNKPPPHGWRMWNTSHRRVPAWMSQPPSVPTPYWGPPPRQVCGLTQSNAYMQLGSYIYIHSPRA
ncbi:hypothetical protein ACEWY4_026582 [Coilia grayii]|uniref:Uncharacterized protein n=1 Tax=Coilia grayii TaxID=363190 RepID=A0ABD1IPZ0_9TELE